MSRRWPQWNCFLDPRASAYRLQSYNTDYVETDMPTVLARLEWYSRGRYIALKYASGSIDVLDQRESPIP